MNSIDTSIILVEIFKFFFMSLGFVIVYLIIRKLGFMLSDYYFERKSRFLFHFSIEICRGLEYGTLFFLVGSWIVFLVKLIKLAWYL